MLDVGGFGFRASRHPIVIQLPQNIGAASDNPTGDADNGCAVGNRVHDNRPGAYPGPVADPYVAGSYAEGRYEIRLPVTAAFVAALKPEYRASFEAQRVQ